MGDGPVTYRCLSGKVPGTFQNHLQLSLQTQSPLLSARSLKFFLDVNSDTADTPPMSLYIQPFMPSAERSKNKSTPHFRIKLLQRELFSMPTSLCHIMCGYVKQEAPKKQHCSRGGPKNEGRHSLVLLHKQAHAKGSIAESVRAAGLNVCEVGVFSKELSNMPTPRLWEAT